MRLILSLITSLVESVTSVFTKANGLVISFVFAKVAPLSRTSVKARNESGNCLIGFSCQHFSRLHSQRA